MIKDSFKINYKNKTISYIPKGSKKTYTLNEFYSFLQNLFDEPQNMKYSTPIEAIPQSKTKTANPAEKIKYYLINGWKIEEVALEHLTGGTLEVVNRTETVRWKAVESTPVLVLQDQVFKG